jgi:hypothetical protein
VQRAEYLRADEQDPDENQRHREAGFVLNRPDQHARSDGETGGQQAPDPEHGPPSGGHRPVGARQSGRELQFLPRTQPAQHRPQRASFSGHESKTAKP